ncbi:Maltose/maltodextrin import ATP-binding protein MalK [Escherichia coli]|nr:Maltose/maltodextrin import ATP-binding protein MalK [Escherichia coli]
MSLGIRPEHLLPSDIADVILEGEVQVVEQLGNETQIHIQILPFVKTGVPPERRGVGRRRCHIRYRPAARALPSVP